MALAKLNFIQREQIVEKYKGGTSGLALAEEYGCDHSSIYRILDAAGVARNQPTFDCELADTLRKEYEAGATTTVLAVKYNTTKQRVARYIREAGGTLRTPGTRVKV